MAAPNFLRNNPLQLYLSIAPAAICGYLAIDGFRDNFIISRYFVWRSNTKVPDSLVDSLDKEFSTLITRHDKEFQNVNFRASLIDNLEPRTYGSFMFQSGSEFQFPVISTIKNANELKANHSNLLDLVKELKLNGVVETSNINEKELEKVLLTESARVFTLRREIFQSESVTHIFIPSAVGTASYYLSYPIYQVITKYFGAWYALVVAGAIGCCIAYYVLTLESGIRKLKRDRNILEEDKTIIQGAIEYFKARLAFGKLLHNLGGEFAKVFDQDGNYLKQSVKYTDRLKQVLEMQATEKKKMKPVVNVRAL